MTDRKMLFIVSDATMVGYAAGVLGEAGLDIPIEHGLWSNGVAIVKKHLAHGLEVVVARAGTARVIREANFDLTVVELPITGFDIIQAVEKAKIYGNRIAVVAFQSMVLGIEYAAKILGVEIGFFYIENAEAIEQIVCQAFSRGYDVVVGGALAAQACRAHKLPHVFIESSRASILQAAFEGLRLARAIETEKYKRTLFGAVLDFAHDGIITIDTAGVITSINPAAAAITKWQNAAGKKIGALWPSLELEKVIATGKEQLNRLDRINEVQIHCNKVPIIVNNRPEGAIATFQDISQIQQLEARIRREIYAAGHVARFTFADIWGKSGAIRQAVNMAKDYARTGANILILGETGTGKEVFAQSIHNYSQRSHGPFVAVNCAALPAQILESELFGYVRGAFTGANREGKPGLFEVAHDGTLFLDEIAELDYANQGRLLRVLQEKVVTRLGSDRVLPVDVRIIAATNRDLNKAVGQRKFRDDLFYRLNVLRLQLPPLRERKADIPLYAKNFLEKYARTNGQALGFRPAALQMMVEHDWPGNVRQLQNTIERVAVVNKTRLVNEATLAQCLDTTDIGADCQATAPREIAAITAALAQAGGKPGKAASLLGINRSTLWRKMRRLGIHA